MKTIEMWLCSDCGSDSGGGGRKQDNYQLSRRNNDCLGITRVSFLYFLRSKVDDLLEILLDQEKYDFRIRPNYDGEPINIPCI